MSDKDLSPSNIYLKYRRGDHLSDAELSVGYKHFSKLSELLYQSGEVFLLAAKESRLIAINLEDFIESRKKKHG